MKVMKIFGVCIAALLMSACNEKVEKELKTIHQPFQTRLDDTYKVTKKYGILKVREGEFTGEAKTKPWSSWWYPMNERTLFSHPEGEPSTLEKFDYYARTSLRQETQAAFVEEQEVYRPSEVTWAGLCHAWAIAAVLHPEPTATKNLGGVKWTVADQKALLLKTYEKATGIADIMYGGRYNGGREDDYDDIYPDQFHRLAQHHLVENQKPFLMDYDPRHPVWTVPTYKVKFIIEKQDEETAKVSAWVSFASPHVDFNFIGTKRVVKNYKYLLKGRWSNGVMTVKSGEWIEGSKEDHPDYLISFPDSIERGSRNGEIKTSIVDRILR